MLMVTTFGRFCRKLRIDKGEILFDMAEKLGVSTAFLSKVENGRRKPPVEWEEKIIDLYSISGDSENEFRECFYNAVNADSINIKNFNEEDKELMLSFARKLDSLDKDAIRKLLD